MAAMLKSITLLALVALPALASAKTLSLPIFQPEKRNIHARSKLARRASGTASVSLGNDVQDGLYYVNATVGTPGQTVQLQIDTGSSDIWMFSPSACQEAHCLGHSCKLSLFFVFSFFSRFLNRCVPTDRL
jgi:predicted aspartyl protease